MAGLVAFAGLTLAYFLMQDEKYEAPTPKGVPSVPVTNDMMETFLSLVQPALSKKIGKCVYPIETSYVRQVGDVFKCRFMFMVMDSYPYGIGVSADIKGSQLVGLEIQNENTIAKVDPFDQFASGEQLKRETLPTVAQLRALSA